MDGFMGQHIQLEPRLIAQPLRQTKAINALVVSGAFGPRLTTLEPINHDTNPLHPIEQPICPCRERNRSGRSSPGEHQYKNKNQASSQK